MNPLKVLITNQALDQRAGTELYVRDVATALLRRGHAPVVYSPRLGAVAREIRAATVPVVDDLDALAFTPDIIHGQHNLETMTALLRFPTVPAVFFCHGWQDWREAPPRFPRLLRYVAVDETCRDRLLCEHAIPEARVRLLLNFVDLERFKPRGPLPARPQRALVFGNNAHQETYLVEVRAACARAGIELDVTGWRNGNASAQPEQLLGQYDLVFAKARCA
ncbi:MAG TPA: glycosyltransferase, partial [Pyrinomonadaceae bacterium]|nr:glycosyltransferase [Pyrinomonadaceae bacterium]